MATITVRNLEDEVQRRLKLRAAAHKRSMEAEVRAILNEAVRDVELNSAWLQATMPFRGEDLPIPARSTPRTLDLA
ncbi:MAG: toxin-antitoxin system antitoxin subunit [Renibacterium sp.]|nr:toxin-antitoxin system antitoxin subunit [Renibacterium sp.]